MGEKAPPEGAHHDYPASWVWGEPDLAEKTCKLITVGPSGVDFLDILGFFGNVVGGIIPVSRLNPGYTTRARCVSKRKQTLHTQVWASANSNSHLRGNSTQCFANNQIEADRRSLDASRTKVLMILLPGLTESAVGPGPLDWFTLQNCLIFSLVNKSLETSGRALIKTSGKKTDQEATLLNHISVANHSAWKTLLHHCMTENVENKILCFSISAPSMLPTGWTSPQVIWVNCFKLFPTWIPCS